MHAIAFALKRAFQATLNISRPTFDRTALTAARFDMLRAIMYGPTFGIRQRDLRRTLGVSGATVSRMVRSLEKLAMVAREVDFRDHRHIRVKITRFGRSMFKRTARAVLPFARRAFVVAMSLDPRRGWLDRMGHAEWILSDVRETFLDTGQVHYPWHPDD